MKETTLSGESLDILSENISKLKELFPEIVTEDKIDFDKFKEVFGNYVEDSPERYNFTWKGKSAALRLAQTPSTGTLRPCKEESKNWDTTENLYIEGDNLEVLKLLQKSYYGKIKMIYIDPPYNTGNEFVYPDDYKDNLHNYMYITNQLDSEGFKKSTNSETDGRYHTNWLNMIYPRLRLARNLLADDGAIFISIGNEEVDNVKKVCNEIFGEFNFRNAIIIRRGAKNLQAQFDTLDSLNSGYEYVLMYSKKSDVRFKKIYKEIDEKVMGGWNNHWRGTDRPTMRYELFGIKPEKGQWRWAEARSNEAIINYEKMLNEIGEKPSQEQIDKWYIKKIYELNINKLDLLRLSKTGKPEHYIAPSNKKLLNDLWVDIKPNGSVFTSQLFKDKIFDNPKSVDLIIRLIDFVTDDSENSILDFFSGSGTTAQAMMHLNSEDGFKRKFIMVQLPEPTTKKDEAFKAGFKNICEIGKERIRRAGDKIISEMNQNGQTSLDSKSNHSLDIGFKVFKLDSSNLSKWDPEYDNLEQTLLDSVENLIPGRNELDLVYEIMLKYGIDLTLPIEEYPIQDKKFYSIGFGALIICLDDNLTSNLASDIIKLKDKLSPEVMRVVFKDNGFASDSDKTNIKETLKTNGIEEFVTI